MTNLMQLGASWLAARLKTAGGVAGVYYRRGAKSASITAVLIVQDYEDQNEEGISTLVKSYDWIFAAADLVVGGETIAPESGDLWKPTAGGTYEVLPVAGRPESEGHDENDPPIMLRVHTKKIAE